MAIYTLKAIVNMSGGKGIKVGDDIPNLNAIQVDKLLRQGVAEFATKKEHKEFIESFVSEKTKRENEIAKIETEKKKQILTNELTLIYTNAVKKEAEIKGKVMTEAEILANVEALLQRIKA